MGLITLLTSVLLVQVYKCQCGLFDYTEIDDPFSFIFNTKEHILNKFGAVGGGSSNDFWNQFSFSSYNNLEGRKCTALSKSDIEPQMGICMSREKCQKLDGSIEWSPSCSFFKTFCCVKKTCGGQSSSIVSHFQNDSETDGNETCTYNLKIRNNVCQIRLDFKKFMLRPPRRRMSNEAFACIDDVFRVVDYPNIPQLCGNNTGQHKIDNKPQSAELFSHEWDIEITQIECPRTSAIRMKRNFLSNPGNEYQLLAPKNCLQYFVAEMGTVRSLNLDSKALGNFIGPIKYAICFYSNLETCGYRFIPEYLILSNEKSELSYDTDCDNQDYIAIPEARNVEDNIKFNRICYEMPQNKNISIISTTPGPFYLMFITNDKSNNGTDNETESGFSIHYKRLHNGCD